MASIVVPNYNHARYLRARVESVLAQTYRDFEVILLDDGSTDESREILRAYAGDQRVRLDCNTENSGSTFRQWNKGVGMARGKYVWIAESDDVADTRLLERLVKILEERPEAAYAYCRSWKVNADGGKEGYSDAFESGLNGRNWGEDFDVDGIEECRRNFALFNPVPNASAVVFRRELYEKAGGADERLKICGDYKVWAGMALQGRVAYAAEPLNYFRWHKENVRTRTSSGYRVQLEHLHVASWVLARVLGSEWLPEVVKRFAEVPPSESGREAQAADCIAAISAVEATLLAEGMCEREAVKRLFDHFRHVLAEKEFAGKAPGRWRFLRHQYEHFRFHAFQMSARERTANLVYLFSAPVLGYRKMHWIGRVSGPVKKMFAARGGQTRVESSQV